MHRLRNYQITDLRAISYFYIQVEIDLFRLINITA